ncbi:hypothetical protein GGI07_000248 [Coemansia sp. Benny D115]|nr:hypothetical protein GGI07_000248 [Coemansia sp. Benny D115]
MSSAAVQLVGIPLSTYTRTIRMALEHLQVPYELIPAAPHSAKAVEYNPFGKIPTMIHDGLIINETPAIRTYLDQTFPSTLTPAMDLNASVNIAMWISITADYIFGTG